MTTKSVVSVLIAALAAALGSGCGHSREMKLSIKPADAERDQPSSALVRKVDITYKNPAGEEKMRESVPVLGLAQPVAMSSDLLKNVDIEKSGVFEARGYTSEGLLVLRGVTTVESDEAEGVEVVMSREESQAAVLDSPLLRSVKLAGTALEQEFVKSSKELREARDAGRCLDAPSLRLSLSTGAYPKLIVEGAVKAPSFRAELAWVTDQGPHVVGQPFALKINPAGDAELELGRELLGGALLKGAARFQVRLYSKEYEGCLAFSTRPQVQQATVRFVLDSGSTHPEPLNRYWVPSLAILMVANPNEVPARVRLGAGVRLSSGSGEGVQPCSKRSNDVSPLDKLPCGSSIVDDVIAPPHGEVGVAIFGGWRGNEFIQRGLRLDWNVDVIFPDLPEERLPAQTGTYYIP